MSENKLDYQKILKIVLIAMICYWGLNNKKIRTIQKIYKKRQ